jgi:hypothetical protein
LWKRAATSVGGADIFSMTWLTANRVYTFTTLAQDGMELIIAELGADDPNFNLRKEQALILRIKDARTHTFVSVLEPHGEYNGPAEFTRQSSGSISSLQRFQDRGADLIQITTQAGDKHFLGLSYDPRPSEPHAVAAGDRTFEWQGYYGLFDEQGKRQL